MECIGGARGDLNPGRLHQSGDWIVDGTSGRFIVPARLVMICLPNLIDSPRAVRLEGAARETHQQRYGIGSSFLENKISQPQEREWMEIRALMATKADSNAYVPRIMIV